MTGRPVWHRRTGLPDARRNVRAGFLEIERLEAATKRDPLLQLTQSRVIEPLRKFRLPRQHQGQQLRRRRLDIREEPDLLDHYQAEVIGGPGSFAMDCPDYPAFAEAIRQKLKREIRGLLLSHLDAVSPFSS